MTYDLTISVADLFAACIAQTAVDFKALRVANPQVADTAYEDYVLSEDLSPEFMAQLEAELVRLEERTASYMQHSAMDSERIAFIFRTASCRENCRMLKGLIEDYLENAMLAWWYRGRNGELQQQCASTAAASMNRIVLKLLPSYMSRRMRFF